MTLNDSLRALSVKKYHQRQKDLHTDAWYEANGALKICCSRCKKTKPCNEFCRSRNAPTGYVVQCIECERGRFNKYGEAIA